MANFDVTAVDPDNDPITLTATSLPAGATFTDNRNGNGRFIWTPNFNQAGDYQVTITARDSLRYFTA